MTIKKKTYNARRKHTRFEPIEKYGALIDFHTKAKKFIPQIVALILTESYGGCSIATYDVPMMEKGARIKIKIGPLSPLNGEVVWVEVIDQYLVKAGIQYRD